MADDYGPGADPVHGSGWNSAARWGGWNWAHPRGAEHFRRCSFCGSIHPGDLAAEPSWHGDWADMKYGWPHKFYVQGVANRHPEIRRIMTACAQKQWDEAQQALSEGKQTFGVGGYEWYPVAAIPAGVDTSGWHLEDGHYSHVGLGSDQTHFVKFYTIHLADPKIGTEVRDAIEQRSGVRFTFTSDGRVSWGPVT